jgi:hypothetical protein
MGLGNIRQPRSPGRLMPRRLAARVLFALLALAAVVAPAAASAQSASGTAQAQAAILTRGAMTTLAGMDFGVIVQPTTAGTVTLTPSLSPTCSASAGIIRTGTCQPAAFSIMFRKHDKNRVREMNGGTIVLTGPGGATMTVTNLTIGGLVDMTQVGTGGPSGTFGRYNIDSDSGIASFRIGGRLNIAANQPLGTYTGELSMNVLLN